MVERSFIDKITVFLNVSTSCFSLYLFTHSVYFPFSLYIYINFKQCKNLPTNTIISINFEDHYSDHGFGKFI